MESHSGPISGSGSATDSGIGRNVYVLSWVSFFQDAASEMLYPVMPIFLTVTLGAPVAALGLIEGVAEATAAIGKMVSGRLADRYARRPLIAIGYGISSLSKPLFALATGWPFVLAVRFGDRVGKGIRTSPRDALIAAEVPTELRGRAFGMHRAFDTAGAVIGPLIGLVLYEVLDHKLRPLFLVAAVPALISVGLIWLVREHRPPAPQPVAKSTEAALSDELPPRFWTAVSFLAIFGLFNFSDAFIILRAHDLGLGFASIILAYALYNFSYAVLSLPAGVVADARSPQLVFGAGMLIFALAYIGLGLAPSAGWVWPLLLLYGGFTALTDGVGKAWISSLLPRQKTGTGLGMFQGITGICSLVAGIWAGLAWHGNGATPLIVSGIAAAVLGIALLLANSTGRLQYETLS